MKMIFTICLIIISNVAKSQNGYEFNLYQSNYENLEDGIILTDSLEGWEGESFPVDLGFTFIYNNHPYTSVENIFAELYFEEESNIVRGYSGAQIEGQNAYLNSDSSGVVYNQPITYKVDGNVGDRIYKVEYKNANSFVDECLSNGMPDSCKFVNFQYWLYETSNIIEIHYGPNNFLDTFFAIQDLVGPLVGLQFDIEEDFLFLTGDSQAPTILADTMDIAALNGILGLSPSPADGTVYRFTPESPNGISNNPITNIKIFPTPAKEYLYIDIDNNAGSYTKIDIINIHGEKILTLAKQKNNRIDVSHLESGLYFLSIYNNKKHLGIRKFFKF